MYNRCVVPFNTKLHIGILGSRGHEHPYGPTYLHTSPWQLLSRLLWELPIKISSRLLYLRYLSQSSRMASERALIGWGLFKAEVSMTIAGFKEIQGNCYLLDELFRKKVPILASMV